MARQPRPRRIALTARIHALGGGSETACHVEGRLTPQGIVSSTNRMYLIGELVNCRFCLGLAVRGGNTSNNANNPWGRKGKPKE